MAPTSLSPGSIFATDFRIVRTLGEGGMGAVYVAEQLSTGKQRALKTMHPQFVADAGLRERFAQEARIGARIESEHVVDVVAAGIDATTKMPWLAMELLKGETVAEAVARGRIVEPRFAVDSLLQLGDALAEGHAAGVVHRDLKPENLFLTTTKRADVPFVLKVLDFGIAKLLSEGATGVTATIGTPMWMAPEQTELGAAITPATDIWAFGLIAFFVLTGQSYWHLKLEGRDVSGAALLRQIVLDRLPHASERAAALGVTTPLPDRFDAWFARCVARDPADRFADGRAALDGLRKVFDASSPSLSATVPADLGLARTQAALTPTPGVGATLPLAAPTPPTPPRPASATTGGGIAGVTPAPVAPSPRAPGKSIRTVAAAALLAAIGGIYALRTHGGTTQERTTPATSVRAPASASAQPAVPPSKTMLVQPRDGRLFSSTPVELKWSHAEGTTREHDIEVVRGAGAATGDHGHSPPGVSYVMWPWPGERAEPGGYRWRVREAGAGWSEWATFSFYPSVLDRVVDQKKLRVGMETTYHEPFVYYDAHQKKVVGFDVDLANELASSLGVTLERVSHEWKDLFTGVEERELDVVLSAVTITKERARKYGFSDPYLRTGVVVTTRASSDRLTAPGIGKTIGAQRQTTAAQTAKRSFPQATFREYDTLDSAFAALSRAEIDALLSDETVVLPRAEVKAGGYRIDSARLTDDAYGIMLPAGDEKLRLRIDEILKELIANGRIAQLKKTYGIR
ncbi:MAG: serine/threonine protein kinase [Labilithrix sp.]|nr:serine/threonine protein kinase [Labilithrix sp.]